MKNYILTLCVSLLCVFGIQAQTISIVSASGSTTLASTLDEAINNATSGSTIYLPGGGFQVNDTTMITKRITLMGISHKVDSENADANTVVSGNLKLAGGSDGSAIMGIYLSGNVYIGVGERVSNIVLKYNNINSIQVQTDSCPGILVNQNFIRDRSYYRGSNAELSNNVCYSFYGINGGIVNYNIIDGWVRPNGYEKTFSCSNSYSKYNITTNHYAPEGVEDVGTIQADVNTIFADWKGITTESDFHFKESYEGERNVGVYAGGTGFSDGCLPPAPHIVSANVDERTDAQGKLTMRIKVKASND